jgi:hypothetical protein
MMFPTRFWSSTAVLLYALLLQNCQSNALRATEEELAASLSSASAMHQRTSIGLPAMRSLTSPSAPLTDHVPSSSLSTPLLANTEEALSTPAAMGNSPTESYDLPAVAMLGASRAVPLGNTLDRAFSPDGSRVCMSKLEGVLRAVPSDEEEASKLSAKRRYSTLAPEDDLANKESRAGERAELGKAKEVAKDARLLAVKTLGEGERRPCAEQRGRSGDPLTILLDVASLKPDRAVQFLDVLLVAAQDKDCRQQALEALGKVVQASSDMFPECLSSLRAAAKGADKDVRVLALKTLGEVEWEHYFGEVGPVPDLPGDIDDILDSACPFWPDRKVRDTHLLALVPATVGEKPFTLNLLGELIKSPNSGEHKTQYRYYDGYALQEQIGNNSPDHPYWLLMTRDVLPESRNKTYSDQKKLVAGHASRTGLPYELPKALEVATAILTHHVRDGERLYSNDPWTFTRCQELIFCDLERYEYPGEYPAVVGGFNSSSLSVLYDRFDDGKEGVAGVRKF